MAAATWRSLAKRAAMWRSLAKSLLAAARSMGALAEMAASPAAQEEVVVAASGAALPSRRPNIYVWRAPKTARLELKPRAEQR